ncbi:hypothetical protein L208DRAFT_880370 [Tricholoma matsutake]|nr:hypothetical protein L208DRAFT_880370 [Tricholoma matsutake 945]
MRFLSSRSRRSRTRAPPIRGSFICFVFVCSVFCVPFSRVCVIHTYAASHPPMLFSYFTPWIMEIFFGF